MFERIVVSGGGIVGLCSALLAAQRKDADVLLLDAGRFQLAPEEQFQRMYAINSASQQLLESLGAWERMEHALCTPYRGMDVRDGNSSGSIRFDCREMALPQLGHIISERCLKKALLEVSETQKNLRLCPEEQIEQIQESEQSIHLQTQSQTIEARLLMVAEGAQSSTRQQLKVPLHHWSYHQHALVTRVRCAQPHKNIARQIFLSSGPLAFLPLPDPCECSIVWSTRPGHASHLKNCPEDVFNQQLSEAFEHCLGAVEAMGPRISFPLHMRHVKAYSGAHWVLMGDAAHNIHPLAGLGLNLGLADVASAKRHFLAGDKTLQKRALARYQRERKTEAWKVIATMQALKSLFENPLPMVKQLRAMGLGMTDRSAIIKRCFMQQAIGA